MAKIYFKKYQNVLILLFLLEACRGIEEPFGMRHSQGWVHASNAEISNTALNALGVSSDGKLFSIPQNLEGYSQYTLQVSSGDLFESRALNAIHLSKEHVLVVFRSVPEVTYQLLKRVVVSGSTGIIFRALSGQNGKGSIVGGSWDESKNFIAASPIDGGEDRLLAIQSGEEIRYLRFSLGEGSISNYTQNGSFKISGLKNIKLRLKAVGEGFYSVYYVQGSDLKVSLIIPGDNQLSRIQAIQTSTIASISSTTAIIEPHGVIYNPKTLYSANLARSIYLLEPGKIKLFFSPSQLKYAKTELSLDGVKPIALKSVKESMMVIAVTQNLTNPELDYFNQEDYMRFHYMEHKLSSFGLTTQGSSQTLKQLFIRDIGYGPLGELMLLSDKNKAIFLGKDKQSNNLYDMDNIFNLDCRRDQVAYLDGAGKVACGDPAKLKDGCLKADPVTLSCSECSTESYSKVDGSAPPLTTGYKVCKKEGTQCPQGENLIDGNGGGCYKCSDAVPNCEECYDFSKQCKRCSEGYLLRLTGPDTLGCVSAGSNGGLKNCLRAQSSPLACLECVPGFEQTSSCDAPCPQFCGKCISAASGSSQKICTHCLEDHKTTHSQSQSGVVSGLVCEECPSGSVLIANECTECSTRPNFNGDGNCHQCKEDGVCRQCKAGFELNSTTKKCMRVCQKGEYRNSGNSCSRCSDSCSQCKELTGECLECNRGYKLNIPASKSCQIVCGVDEYRTKDNTCSKCPVNCKKCSDETGLCMSCSKGFSLSKDNKLCSRIRLKPPDEVKPLLLNNKKFVKLTESVELVFSQKITIPDTSRFLLTLTHQTEPPTPPQ